MQASAQGASVKGLKGCKTLNKDPDPKNPLEGTEERPVSFSWNASITWQKQNEFNSLFFSLLAG